MSGMSVWVIGLGLAAGFLINKNLTMDHRIKDATKKYNEAAQSETQEIRKVQSTVPLADKYQDMNLQDLCVWCGRLPTVHHCALAVIRLGASGCLVLWWGSLCSG